MGSEGHLWAVRGIRWAERDIGGLKGTLVGCEGHRWAMRGRRGWHGARGASNLPRLKLAPYAGRCARTCQKLF